ncbi:MAG: metallophosphoesterase [Polyangiaceae bacterium]
MRRTAFMVLGFALFGGCDGDDVATGPIGTGGTAGARADSGSSRPDGALDGVIESGAGGADSAPPNDARDGGALDTGTGPSDSAIDGASRDTDNTGDSGADADADADGDDDDDDAGEDAADSGDGAISEDASFDASIDTLADSGDVFDAPPDVPRDTGPIVIGPPFRRSVQFAVIGDYGNATTNEARVSNLVHSWDIDFVLTTGDNNYTGNTDGVDGVIGRYYADFIGNYWGAYGPGSRTTRFWPSPGNHDWDVASLTAYTDYFTLPGNERYYDVDLGLVHLFAVDSDPREPDGTSADSVQGRWLQARLASSDACFNVVYFHHPAYSSSSHGSSLDMRWPFEAWGADVVFAGHDHVYERFEIGTIPYFTVGLGGGPPYPFVTTLPETRHQYNADFGALRVDANRRGIRYEFFDANGTLVESFATRKRCR